MSLSRLVSRLASSRWLRIAAMLVLAGIAVAALYPAANGLPRTRLPGPVEHFLAYAAAAAIATFAFRRLVRPPVLAAAMIVYAALLEIAQRWAPGRSAELIDFVGSAAGVVLGVTFCAAALRWLDRVNGKAAPVRERVRR